MAKYLMRVRLFTKGIRARWTPTVVRKKAPGHAMPGVSPTARMFAMLLLVVICLILGIDLSQLPLYQGILIG